MRPSAPAPTTVTCMSRLDLSKRLLRIDEDRDRPLVLEADQHVGAELPRLHFQAAPSCLLHEALDHRLRARRLHRVREARAKAAAHVAEERELRDDEERAPRVGDAL